MSERPLVSVITPCYNHVKYIRNTIESVVNQTYTNIEYFVIDDGSTDGSVEIINELKEKYNFHFEVQQNKGLASTMNRLIAQCNGKYVAGIESDDVWTLDKIEKQIAFMQENKNVAACGGNALCINERNEILPPKKQTPQKYTVYNFEDIMAFDYQIFPLTIIIRKEIYDLVGEFDESFLYIDAYTWLKITVHNHSIVILPELFGYYRIHESNVHYDSLNMYKTLIKTFDKFKDHPLYPKARRNAMSYFFPYLAVKDKKEALSILPEAFKFKWRIFKGMIALMIPYPLIKFLSKTRYR